jgi:putative ABC transport system permease protein
VDRFALALRPGSDPRAAGAWIEGLAFGTQAIPTADLARQASTTFEVVSRFHDAIGIITMFASSIFLLCLMVIRVDERRAQVRTMGLIGISRRTVFITVVVEAVAISVVSAILGGALGLLATAGVNAYYGAYYQKTLQFAAVTPRILWTAAGVGVALGIGAGMLAALRIVRIPPQRLGER